MTTYARKRRPANIFSSRRRPLRGESYARLCGQKVMFPAAKGSGRLHRANRRSPARRRLDQAAQRAKLAVVLVSDLMERAHLLNLKLSHFLWAGPDDRSTGEMGL